MSGANRIEADTVTDAGDRALAATAEHVLILLPALAPADAALARAQLAALAIRRTPGRVNALAGGGEGQGRAAQFLEGARSTTGQLLELRS